MTRANPGSKLLIAGTFLHVGGLVVAPLLALIVSALTGGLGRFLRSFVEGGAWQALAMTVALTAVTVIVNGVFGTVTAWALTRDDFRGRAFINALVDIPFAISPVIVGFSLIVLFGPKGWLGAIPRLFELPIIFAFPGMALATVIVSLPFVVREVGIALEQLGPEQEEAAYSLGASPLRTFFQVTLPSLRRSLVNGVLLTSARAIGEFGAILIVSGGVARATETGTLYVFRALDERHDQAAYAVSLALVGMSVGILALLAQAPGSERRARGAAR